MMVVTMVSNNRVAVLWGECRSHVGSDVSGIHKKNADDAKR